MTTSGSYDWDLTSNQMIKEAAEMVGFAVEEDLSPAEYATCRRTLNGIGKALQSDNVLFWTRQWTTQTFTASSEVTATDGNIYTCVRGHTGAANSKPITGADWSTYWKQKGSTGGVHTIGTIYTAIGDFALNDNLLDLESPFIRYNGDDQPPLKIITIDEYMTIPDKYTVGMPEMIAIDRRLSQRAYLYPQPDLTSYVLHYLKTFKLQDFDTANNSPDAPSRWFQAIVSILAFRLSLKFDVSDNKRATLQNEATKEYRRAKNGNVYQPANTYTKSAFAD